MTDKKVFLVFRDDDRVDAETHGSGGLPKVPFTYRPMSSREHGKYLTAMTKAGENVEKLMEVNFRLLSNHVSDIDLRDSKDVALDFKKADAWAQVNMHLVSDLIAEVTGLSDEEQEEEEKVLSDF